MKKGETSTMQKQNNESAVMLEQQEKEKEMGDNNNNTDDDAQHQVLESDEYNLQHQLQQSHEPQHRLLGFGSNYFHALGGSQSITLTVPSMMTMNKDDNNNNNATTTSTDGSSDGVNKSSISNATTTSTQSTGGSKNGDVIRPKDLVVQAREFKYPNNDLADNTSDIQNKNCNHHNHDKHSHNDENDDNHHHLDINDIAQICCTTTSTIVLTKSKGHIYQVGMLHGYQWKQLTLLPLPTTTTTSPSLLLLPSNKRLVLEIAGGRHFCVARCNDHSVLSWGAGHFGQLGLGPTVSHVTHPTLITRLLPQTFKQQHEEEEERRRKKKMNRKDQTGEANDDENDDHTDAKEQDAKDSRNINNDNNIDDPQEDEYVVSIACGSWHAAALTNWGRIYCWGSNRRNQCGRPAPATMVFPQRVPAPPVSASSAVSSSASVTSLTPTAINNTSTNGTTRVLFSQVVCGKNHTVALERTTGRVYTWGASIGCGHSPSRKHHYNNNSTATTSTSPTIATPKLVEALQRVVIVQIAAGDGHSLALTGGGRVFSWGQGSEGQLGMGGAFTMISRPKLIGDLDFVAVVAAGQQSQSQQHQQQQQNALMSSMNLNPSIAGGDTAPGGGGGEAYHVASTRNLTTSTVPQGSNLAPSSAPNSGDATDVAMDVSEILANVPKVTSIYAAGSYSLAISSAGHAYGWGYNDVNVLGLPLPSSTTSPISSLSHGDDNDVLPVIEPASVNSITATMTQIKHRTLESQSFDSRHNILLPRRIDALHDLHVTMVAGGPSHLLVYGQARHLRTNNYNHQHNQKDNGDGVDSGSQNGDDRDEEDLKKLNYNTVTAASIPIGRTLYEVQQLRKAKSGFRAHSSSSLCGSVMTTATATTLLPSGDNQDDGDLSVLSAETDVVTTATDIMSLGTETYYHQQRQEQNATASSPASMVIKRPRKIHAKITVAKTSSTTTTIKKPAATSTVPTETRPSTISSLSSPSSPRPTGRIIVAKTAAISMDKSPPTSPSSLAKAHHASSSTDTATNNNQSDTNTRGVHRHFLEPMRTMRSISMSTLLQRWSRGGKNAIANKPATTMMIPTAMGDNDNGSVSTTNSTRRRRFVFRGKK